MAEMQSKGQPDERKPSLILGEKRPKIHFSSVDGPYGWTVYWHSIESFLQGTHNGMATGPVVVHLKGGKRIEVAGTYEDVRRVVQEAEHWKKPSTFGVALEDSQQIGTGKYKCNVRLKTDGETMAEKQPEGGEVFNPEPINARRVVVMGLRPVTVRLLDNSHETFDYNEFRDVRAIKGCPKIAEMRLRDGSTMIVDHSVDELLEIVRAAKPDAPAEPVTAAQVETVTLRDRFALAALPAITEKYCRENRNVLDRENLALEVWQLADEMMKARGE